MNLTTRLPILALHLLVAACGVHGSGDAPQTTTAAPQPGSETALRIEQAERLLDTGRDVPKARVQLAEVLRDAQLDRKDRDRATLASSRAAALAGEQEEALRTVEQLLASHVDDHPWALEDAASKHLRKMLTGSDATPRSMREREKREVAPIAHALTPFFPSGPGGEVTVRIVRYGGSSETSQRLGTWNVAGAVTEARHTACPLCEEQGRTHTFESGEGSWTAIPKNAGRATQALEIFYYDLGEGRVPSRYDARLPMPSAEIAARLSRGEGVIAVKQRGDAPPAVLIAAPRWAQLVEVEEAFAKMTALPAEPVSVPVTLGLRPEEIQAEVRASFGAFRQCYEGLLARSPAAAGKSMVAFSIEPDGSVSGATIDEQSSLHDATMDACLLTAFRAIRFSSTGKLTTVKYPIAFAP